MSNVNFITSNPAIQAFQDQQNHLQRQQANDLRLRREQMELAEQEAMRGYRMEEAGLRMEGLRRDNTEANATSLDRVTQSGQNTQLGGQRLQAGEQSLEAGQRKNDLAPFYESIDLIKAGNYEAAKQIAKGMTDPGQHGVIDTMIDNAQYREAFVRLVDTARNDYASNPAAQQEFILKGLQQILSQEATIDRTDPAAPQRVQDAPERPTSATGTGNRLTDKQWIYQMAVGNGMSHQEAMGLVTGQKPPDDSKLMDMARQYVDTMYRGSMASETERQEAYETQLRALREQLGVGGPRLNGTANPAPAPAAPAAPAAPQADTGGMSGGGTQDDPYQATTQEQVEWFKTKAPAGTIIVINGTPYMK